MKWNSGCYTSKELILMIISSMNAVGGVMLKVLFQFQFAVCRCMMTVRQVVILQ